MVKKCNKCNNIKSLDDFYKKKGGRYHCSICKECDKQKCRDHRAKNSGKDYQKLRKAQYLKNKDRENYLSKRWDEENRQRKNALCAKYRAKKLNATIPGFDEEIKEVYDNCPKDHHVDHIIPLQGKTVSGLHVPWNLQYLLAADNLSKGNKLLE